MSIRKRTEEMEYKWLSPFAAKSHEAMRKRDEKACEIRTAFQRDRDRIIHCKAFRRLKHKAQVYISPADHYRTRMTHSLEVAQIARTIARGLQLNEDLTEAVALGHDVGHTPFGHAGEYALKEILGEYNHNKQSLRVVEYVECNGDGLNLTVEVLDGILNHTGGQKPSTLEGKVVRLCDRIAYLCHDYDDGIRARILEATDLPELVTKVLGTNPSRMIKIMVSDIIIKSEGQDEIIVSDDVQMAMDKFREFMFEKIYHSVLLAEERGKAKYIISKLFEYYINTPEALPRKQFNKENMWDIQTTVTDYVSGLSDEFAINLFKELFIPITWNIKTKLTESDIKGSV